MLSFCRYQPTLIVLPTQSPYTINYPVNDRLAHRIGVSIMEDSWFQYTFLYHLLLDFLDINLPGTTSQYWENPIVFSDLVSLPLQYFLSL